MLTRRQRQNPERPEAAIYNSGILTTQHTRTLLTLVVAIATASAGPIEFGTQELRQAIAARNLPERTMPNVIEVSAGSRPESFQISPGRISGGDLRGLMYGLLEAASRIRTKGKLTPTSAEAVVPLRGVRIVLRNEEWEKRQIVFGADDKHWTPVYPHLFSLPLFPLVEQEGITAFERGRNMDALRMISQTAVGCGIDFAIGIQSPANPLVPGLTADRHSAYFRSAFAHLLAEIPSIRVVSVTGTGDML